VGTGHVSLDINPFVIDNSDTRKEGVGHTYTGVDSYPPIGAYLGNAGYCVGMELRKGSAEEVVAATKSNKSLDWETIRKGKQVVVFEDILVRQRRTTCGPCRRTWHYGSRYLSAV